MRACVRLAIKLESTANLRECWQKGLGRKAKFRKAGYVATLAAIREDDGTVRPCWMTGRVTVTLTRIGVRSLDDDNLAHAFKAFRDGVADALGCKDNDPRLTWRYGQLKGAMKEYGIQVEFVEGEACET
jgi:hypothetical protein